MNTGRPSSHQLERLRREGRLDEAQALLAQDKCEQGRAELRMREISKEAA